MLQKVLIYTTHLQEADSDAKSALLGGTGITYDSASGGISLTNTNVTQEHMVQQLRFQSLQ